MEIWYINLRKSLEIQTSVFFSNVLLMHNLDIMWQSACLVFNPNRVEGHAAPSSSTLVD